jgi:acyl-CoA reductase-like NAD-dependent aldehyde dehydrogenase
MAAEVVDKYKVELIVDEFKLVRALKNAKEHFNSLSVKGKKSAMAMRKLAEETKKYRDGMEAVKVKETTYKPIKQTKEQEIKDLEDNFKRAMAIQKAQENKQTEEAKKAQLPLLGRFLWVELEDKKKLE